MQERKWSIPADLAALAQWVCWGAPGKARKCPYNPRTGYPAKAGQPDTWADLATATAAVNAGYYEGVGFEFNGGGIVGVDFDHCIQGGKLDAWAAAWVERFNSYTEVSPSGTGLHILCRGKLPGEAVKKPRGEMYDRARYFTITGMPWDGPAKPLRDAQEAVTALYEELQAGTRKSAERPTEARTAPHGAVSIEDAPLIEKMKRGRNGAEFSRLWAGDISAYPSHSEADIALCNALAWWTNCDAARVDRLFRQSGLMREKWDRQQSGTTYGAITVQNAVNTCRGGYDPGEYFRQQAAREFAQLPAGRDGDVFGRAQPQTPACVPQLARASDIPYEPPRWTIAPYFQRGKGTLIQGDNGSGKTAFMCAVVAHITTGRPLLGCEVEAPGNVLMLSIEDDLPVLRGRIEADGGDLTTCYFLTNAAGLTFTSPEVEAAIKEIDAQMVVFDPFQAFLGAGVDMWRPNETRPQLAKLFEVCDRYDCSCVIISHMGKSGDKSPVNRSLGSVDIPAAMRSILQLIRNPDNDDECIMVHVKCSNAPKGRSIAYTIGDRGGVHWEGYSEMTADDLTQVIKRKEKGIPYEREPLVQVFNQLITNKPGGGFWSYSDLKSEGAKILGFPPFGDIGELRSKLDSGLAKELQQRDGLLVTYGAKNRKNERGIRIERYEVPQAYQSKIEP